MTRPTIVRADTIDLQDHHAPSAQDHSKSPRSDTAPSTASPDIAPHQAETIREVHDDTAEEELRTPRISWVNGNNIADLHQHAEDLAAGVHNSFDDDDDDDDDDDERRMAQEDALAIAQNGGVSSSDEGDLDGDSEDLDDDLMDKISSSPSIEDGGCHFVTPRTAWPQRTSSLRGRSPKLLELSNRPPTPYLDAPAHLRRHSPASPHQLASLATLKQVPAVGQQDATSKEGGFGLEDHDLLSKCTQEQGQSQTDKTPDVDDIDDESSLLIPYEQSFEDDDDTNLSYPEDPRYIDSGWAGECLQDLEDIDFEFVYALHTFVATVEGQANATKGDTMVLLDDSNSYWWLVRVVKDSSIGYLPAEHIETPTERLARLNKHRNVDLSATMLGDQAVKEKASFTTAIRRRRKTVTFAPPTFVDYSDFDYSTDEEDLDDLFAGQPSVIQQAKEAQQAEEKPRTEEDQTDESAKVEPLKPRANKEVRLVEPTKIETVEEEETRSSEEILLDSKLEGPNRSRNGTVRNTDSFFKDESVETKKITLTPNLLRDDNQPRPSQDSITKDVKSRPSLDKLDKELMSDKEKKKLKEGAKKEKEKKPSAIRSFFSRKDKKKTIDDDDESFGKRSMDIVSEPQSRDSESIEEQGSPEKPQRNPSKLQKQQPRAEPSPTRKGASGSSQQSSTMELAAYLAESRTNDVSNVPPASMRIVDPETQETKEVSSNQQRGNEVPQERSASAAAQRSDPTIKILPRSASAASETRPYKSALKARIRTDLDDIESSDEETKEPEKSVTLEPVDERNKEKLLRPQLPGAFPDSFETTSSAATEATVKAVQQDRLSESPVQVSPVTSNHPPALEIDTSSQEGRSSEETPSPDLLHGDETPKDSSSTRSGKEPGWDDAKLRAFFDEGEHVRDLLVVVYDKTAVTPAGKDHPVAGGLFREQNAKLAEITTQLDNMLGDWLARKQRMRGTL
ncbi:Fc.00g003480.m01.CDS01 [Cosmosporella sp. VM-42]